MKKQIAILSMAVGVLAAFSPNTPAQTNAINVTNVVTIMVTNIVSVTNVTAKTYAITQKDAASVTNEIVQPPKYPWDSSVSAGLTLTSGNSDTLLATAGAETHKKTPENEFSFGADGGYGTTKVTTGSGTNKTSQTERTTGFVHGFGQYNHLFTEKFYGYVRAEALHDDIADLQYRLTIGPGAGYYFIKETNMTFAGEIGASYVTQRLGDADDDYATLRLAENFEYKFKRFGARFWEKAEILPQVNDFNNYLVNAEAGIESSITKTISLKTFVVDNYNSEPAAGRVKNDVKLISGISYKF